MIGWRQNLWLVFTVWLRRARVKRWGKSPPLGRRRSRHGKPRVEQGQIGGEGWPGPLGPSGRPLESGRETGPRGMIAPVASRSVPTLFVGKAARAGQNPAYRPARQIHFEPLLAATWAGLPADFIGLVHFSVSNPAANQMKKVSVMACFPEQRYEERGEPSRWFAPDMGRILRLPSIGRSVRSFRALRCDAKVHFHRQNAISAFPQDQGQNCGPRVP